MSNVTKPILLDETGKEILGALRDLVTARENPVVQAPGYSKKAVMSQKAITSVFDGLMEKEEGATVETEIAALPIEAFSKREGTVWGDTELIEVVPSGTYVLSFDSCIQHSGAAELYVTEYTEAGEIATADTMLYFERLGTGFAATSSLIASMFPNGGRCEITVGENTKYITLAFSAYVGAPERLPKGLTLAYKEPVIEYGKIKEDKIPPLGSKNFKTEVVSNNLFNKATATTQETVYIGKSTSGEPLYGWYCGGAPNAVGTTVSGDGYDSVSKAIEVEGGQSYCKNAPTGVIVNCFDENDVWIRHDQYPFAEKMIVTPPSAKYVRLSFVSAEKDIVYFAKSVAPLNFGEYAVGVDGLSVKGIPSINEMLARNGLDKPYRNEYMWKIAEEANKYTASNRHTFLFITDTHAAFASDRLISVAAAMTKYVPCSYIAHGGDIIDGTTEKKNELLLLTTFARNGNDAQCPTFYAKGNHDWNSLYVEKVGASDDEYILNADLARRTNCFQKHKIIGNIEQMYFFYDDESTKVRTIFLNGFNEDEGGSASDLVRTVQRYSQAQLEWLANTALNFSNKSDKIEWGVVIVTHQAPSSGIYGSVYGIVEHFKAGTSGTLTVADGGASVTIAVDFTEQGAMECIAVFVGDIHLDRVTRVGSEKPTTQISVLNASLAIENVGMVPSLGDALMPPNKIRDTVNETAFDIVTIDRVNKLIYLTRYGARSYAYNEETGVYDKIVARTRIVDYSTGEYIVLAK